MDQIWPNYESKAAHLWIKGGPPFVQRQRGFGIKISAGLIKSQRGFGAIKIGNEFNGKTERDCILAEFDNVAHFR